MSSWRVLSVVALILVFGVLRRPAERDIAEALAANHFREGTVLPEGPLREKLGQLGAAAALGGFRSFLATLYELRAITAYSDVDYEAVESLYHVTTQLQPLEPGYWNTAAWMMDSNARRYYLSFDRDHSPTERELLARLSVERGKAFLEDGLRFNPDDYVLLRSLANHHAHRQADFCQAAKAFGRAAAVAGKPGVAARHHAIYLALCPGREREAHAKLRALAESIRRGESVFPRDVTPASLALHLGYLEHFLGVPHAERFQTAFDFAGLYNRLRAQWKPGERYPALHQIRMRRLEEILNIPPAQRIPTDVGLAPP